MTGGRIMHSIRTKITAITVIAIIITELIVFAVTYVTLGEEHERDSVEMMNLIAENTKKSIENYTEGIQLSMEIASNMASDSMDTVVLAESGLVGSSKKRARRTEEQKEEFDRYLGKYCDKVQNSFASIASHTHGVVSYYYCIDSEISENVHGFLYSRAGKTGFQEQTPIDVRILDSGGKAYDIWYFKAVSRGRPSWVGPYMTRDQAAGQVCSYVIPIYESGLLIGVMGMDISLETLIEQVKTIKVYKTGFACLLSEEDRVVYHPDLEFGSNLDLAGLSGRKDLLEKRSNGDALLRYDYNGQQRQLSFCTLTNGMVVAVVAPTSEINADWIRLGINDIAATIVIMIIFAILVMLILRFLTGPLLKLAHASRKLADSDYDIELDYKGNDEVGVLTKSFVQMRDQIKAYIADLNRRIYTDDLTGLANTRRFFKVGEDDRRALSDEGKSPVLLYFDLIGMKNFNRQYGYEEGNRLLCDVAEIIKAHFGEQNVSRIGQDHFAAITAQEGLEAELETIFSECRTVDNDKSLPVHVGIYPYSVGDVSVNIACDRAKYICDRYKDSYISGYYYFDAGMAKEVEDVRYIINHLDQALSYGWIKVYYQPIIETATGEKTDEEALSRWIDPNKGFLSPDEFIPYLENAGIIYKLDLYVLDQVLDKIKYLKEKGEKIASPSVNLSRTDFDACDMVEEIRKRVDAAGVERNMISIEITESIIGSDFEFMKKQVERFQDLGFEVWMDDFGSGYSSLDVLQDIHFDLIKLDMRFMHRFGEGEEGKIIVGELLSMANRLGVKTICEGVETEEQVKFLRENGCTKIQGYYYGKPAPFEMK